MTKGDAAGRPPAILAGYCKEALHPQKSGGFFQFEKIRLTISRGCVHSWGMAKQTGPVKVTITSPTEVWEGNVSRATVSSTNGGLTHELVLGTVNNFMSYPTAFSPYAQGGTTAPRSAAMTKREAVIKHVLEMAKAVEKQRFEGARLVELAEAEAIDATNKRLHAFNLSVLSAVHEGLNESDVRNALVRAGLVDFGEDVDDVALRDLSALYPRVEADGEE